MKQFRYLRFALLVIILTLLGCVNQTPKHKLIIVIVDPSMSIVPEARQQEFRTLVELPAKLHRGDSLCIIPATGDAETESQGHVFRLTLAETREPYDQDLKKASAKVNDSVQQLSAESVHHPGLKTDLLGALRLATEEIAMAKGKHDVRIIILSDFIQDDALLDFKSDTALAKPESALALARKLAKQDGYDLHGIQVFLGHLRSNDLIKLGHQRRSAMDAFWIEYFSSLGASVKSATDGPGLVGGYI